MKTDQTTIKKYEKKNLSSKEFLTASEFHGYTMLTLNLGSITKAEKNIDDILEGILSGTGLVHTFLGHVSDAFNGRGYEPHNQALYRSVKAVTATLEILGYYTLAKNGHNGTLIALGITNGLSVLRKGIQFAVNSGY